MAFADEITAIVHDPLSDQPSKIKKLESMRAAFLGIEDPEWPNAVACRRMMMAENIGLFCGLERFKGGFMMLHQKTCPDWTALSMMAWHQAAPMGRLILGLSGESRDLGPMVDHLAVCVHLLNHLVHMRQDYDQYQRLYLPDDWLLQAGVTEKMLHAPCLSAPLRHVLYRMLGGIEGMLVLAAPLKERVQKPDLAAGILVVERLCQIMIHRLRHDDPFMHDIAPGRWALVKTMIAGGGYYAARILR